MPVEVSSVVGSYLPDAKGTAKIRKQDSDSPLQVRWHPMKHLLLLTSFCCLCSNGIGRTGTFCAIFSIIESLKVEGVVDVFYRIKVLRTQHPGIVQTLVRVKSSNSTGAMCIEVCIVVGTVHLLSCCCCGVSGWL